MENTPDAPRDKEIAEAVELFRMLSYDEKQIILDRLKSLLSEK